VPSGTVSRNSVKNPEDQRITGKAKNVKNVRRKEGRKEGRKGEEKGRKRSKKKRKKEKLNLDGKVGKVEVVK
jgi:hypothetical protein